jgi:predicted DsbA family dithiol-disulfide isomerase
MSDKPTLQMFTDYVCPWCYLTVNRVKKLAETYDIDVKLVHYPLHPETPPEGRDLEDLFGGGPANIAAKNNQMKARMDAEGLDYAPRSHTYNSRLAQELGVWADTQPDGKKLHEAFYRAYFVDRRNLADIDVLLDVVKACGFDVDEAREVIESRKYRNEVDADWQKSKDYGVTGVPTFVAGERAVVGAQPYEVLEQLVAQAGAAKR